MIVEGSNGSVEIVGSNIVIRRKGIANILTQGLQGDKYIPLPSVTSVQFRSAGSLMAGMIQFTLLGGREFGGGMLEATKDENAVLFDKSQEPHFCALRDYVKAAISKQNSHYNAVHAGLSLGEELTKLADLRDRGVLTAEEFESAKKSALAVTNAVDPFAVTDDAENQSDPFANLPPLTAPQAKSGPGGCAMTIYIVAGILLFLIILGSIVGPR